MSRGKRYNHEPKLNIKKVIAVVLMMVIFVAFAFAIKRLLSNEPAEVIRPTEYYSFYENNKWGVLDSNANIVLKATYDEMIVIPDHGQDVFLCTEIKDYAKKDYQVKVMNSKNKEVLKEYTNIKAIENYDSHQNLWYEKNILTYEKDGKIGAINLKGKEVLKADYDAITALKGTRGVLLTTKDGKLGLVNLEGAEIIPNQYLTIQSLGGNSNLYIVKNENKKYGIYGVLEEKYEAIQALGSKDYFCVKEDNHYKIINSKEENVFNKSFDKIKKIKDTVVVYKDGKYTKAYDMTTKKTVSDQYTDIEYTSEGYFIVKKGNNYGIVDSNNKVKEKMKYASITYEDEAGIYELESKSNVSGTANILNRHLVKIADGVLEDINSTKSYIKVWTEEGSKYFNLEGEEKAAQDILPQNNLFLKKEDGKYGYVDKKGTTIVEAIYDDAKEQNAFGYAAVKKDGNWGAIDSKGNIVCETNKNLEDYLFVDFIGEYHLGKDINLMYYTK